jgi:hypothetical protein
LVELKRNQQWGNPLLEVTLDFHLEGGKQKVNFPKSWKNQLLVYIKLYRIFQRNCQVKSLKKMTIATIILMSSAQAALAGQHLETACGSTGQLCDNGVQFSFDVHSSSDGSPFVLHLQAPRTHCSEVRYIINSGSGKKSATRFLQPGQTGSVNLGVLATGAQTINIKAEGKVGGCNVGTLQSWGVNAFETTR